MKPDSLTWSCRKAYDQGYIVGLIVGIFLGGMMVLYFTNI